MMYKFQMGDFVRYFGDVTYVGETNPKIGMVVGIRTLDGQPYFYDIVDTSNIVEVITSDIVESVYATKVMPIGINADILVALGFNRLGKTNHFRYEDLYERCSRNFALMEYFLEFPDNTSAVRHQDCYGANPYMHNVYNGFVSYVHELQHIARILKFNKELKLWNIKQSTILTNRRIRYVKYIST